MDEQSGERRNFLEPPDGLLTAPENRVLVLVDTADEAGAAIDELALTGFGRDEIFVLCGPKGAERLDMSGRDHGLRARTYRIMEWMGDEREVLLRSGEHLAAGGLVITVPTDEDTKPTAARILAAHGGHEIAHFGKGHWEPLGP